MKDYFWQNIFTPVILIFGVSVVLLLAATSPLRTQGEYRVTDFEGETFTIHSTRRVEFQGDCAIFYTPQYRALCGVKEVKEVY